jgi:hypothetical protein
VNKENIVMGQTARTSNGVAKPVSYWKTLQERMKAGEAVDVLNRAVMGEDIPSKQLNTSMFYVNKLLPSMQAIAVQVEHKVSASMPDLTARALAAGLDPAVLFHGKRSITQEKKDSLVDDSEAPNPRNCAANDLYTRTS